MMIFTLTLLLLSANRKQMNNAENKNKYIAILIHLFHLLFYIDILK